MDRVAVFVDAGYLFAEGSKRLTRASEPTSRSQLTLNTAGVLRFLDMLVQETGLPLLRIYWYDGVYGAEPSAPQLEMAFSPFVKLRLGVVTRMSKQKGVDSLIVTDMITLSRNRAIASAILLAGDEDLRVGVQQSQEQGIHARLVGWASSQSMLLRQEADVVREIADDEVVSFLSVSVDIVLDRDQLAANLADGDPIEVVPRMLLEKYDQEALVGLRERVSREGRPYLPPEVDRALIRSLANACGGGELTEDQKVRVREEFRKQLHNDSDESNV